MFVDGMVCIGFMLMVAQITCWYNDNDMAQWHVLVGVQCIEHNYMILVLYAVL